jgi:hypothetical protein
MDQIFQRTIILLVALGGLLPASRGQNDSTLLLAPERLTEKDVVFKKMDDKFVPFTSATRNVENSASLPFTTWVITAEDILRYGFVTLTDVLKAAPGMRVSQPGNAMEGETFLMRGQVGNQYVKILINDIPVKNSVALGTPIGAQLPIRQAARIEVIYGPQGVMYGNEACVGVVNIILKETERPIFTQADLSFGSQGFNNLDLSFGGKLFSDKNILRFSAYGSSTVRSSTDVYRGERVNGVNIYDLELYSLGNIDNGILYKDNPNFIPESFAASTPRLVDLTHESRLFGLSLAWRGLNFSYTRMYRRDMSCLGYNPMARSYSDAGSTINEEGEMYSLGFRKRWGRFRTSHFFALNDYRIFGNSGTKFIFDQYSMAYTYANGFGSNANANTDSLLAITNSTFNSGQRFGVARGLDLRWESHGSARLWNQLWLQTDLAFTTMGGRAYTNRYIAPIPNSDPIFNATNLFDLAPFVANFENETDLVFATHLDWRGSKLRVIGGASIGVTAPSVVRLGASYRLDSTFSFFTNYSKGYKIYHFYESANTYRIFEGRIVQPESDARGIDETFEHFEAGVRLGMNSRYTELMFFSQTANNLMRAGQIQNLGNYGGEYDDWLVGYSQFPTDWTQRIWGLQGRIGLNSSAEFSGKEDGSSRTITWRGEYHFQITRGSERWLVNNAIATGAPFNVPRFMGQFRTTFQSRKLQITLVGHQQGEVVSKSKLYTDDTNWARFNTLDNYERFRTWDAMSRFYLNKNFAIYLLITNLFNRSAYGLDATGSPDDLAIPVQPGRQFRLGVNYNMN